MYIAVINYRWLHKYMNANYVYFVKFDSKMSIFIKKYPVKLEKI